MQPFIKMMKRNKSLLLIVVLGKHLIFMMRIYLMLWGRVRKNQDSLDKLNKIDTSSLPLTEQFNFATAKERAKKQ